MGTAEAPPKQLAESLDRRKLRVFLERRRLQEAPSRAGEVRVEELLQESLQRVNEFVPSTCGALLLDNPITKRKDKRENDLIVVAAFSQKTGLNPYPPGRTVPAYGNTVGNVYLTGQPYIGNETEIKEADTLLAVPVMIEREVCGVLLLRNRLGQRGFSDRDLKLLNVFADYMSSVIVNILEAERAKEMSIRDGLTGLFNDRYFHAQLSKEIVVAEDAGDDLSLVFMDLDSFKQVNDTHGHLAGSMVLKEVGALIKTVVNLPGATLTRYGGDEFVLVLPKAGAATAADYCERLRCTIKDFTFLAIEGPYGPPLRIGGIITCSIGVASYHEHVRKRYSSEQNKDALLKLADRAMYGAKEQGKNRIVLAEREPEAETPPPRPAPEVPEND